MKNLRNKLSLAVAGVLASTSSQSEKSNVSEHANQSPVPASPISIDVAAGRESGSKGANQTGPNYEVTRLDDPSPGSCEVFDCSLREAINAANGLPAQASIITFDQSILLGGDSITLTYGQLSVASPITIEGSDVTIAGSGSCYIGAGVQPDEFRLMYMNTSTAVTLEDLTFTGGCADGGISGGAIYASDTDLILRGVNFSNNQSDGNGGAIAFTGNLILNCNECSFTANTASGNGGAMWAYNNDSTILDFSTLTGNSSGGYGGAVWTNANDLISVYQSLLSGNSSTDDGGAVYVTQAPYFLSEYSTFAGNSAGGYGGAIASDRSALNIVNATFSENQALGGGGLFTSGPIAMGGDINLRYVSLVDNQATMSGDQVFTNGGTGSINITGTLIAGTGTSACSITSPPPINSSYVVATDSTCTAFAAQEEMRVALNLSPLGDFGGNTPVHAPLPGSPLINAGGACTGVDDQRLFTRPFGGACDVGSVEVQDSGGSGPDFVVNDDSDDGDGFCGSGFRDCTLRDAILAANGNPDASVITFDANTFLGGKEIILENGQLDVTAPVTINGPADESTITRLDVLPCVLDGVQADGEFRLFEVSGSGQSVQISDLTLSNGCADGTDPDGGAIQSSGAYLHLQNVSLMENSAYGDGGALRVYGYGMADAVYIVSSRIEGNTATGDGGGLFTDGNAPLTIETSTIAANTGFDGGGLLRQAGTLTITASTFSENVANGGAGFLHRSGDMSMVNSTVTGNMTTFANPGAISGVQIQNSASASIINSTIADNVGGGAATQLLSLDSTVYLDHALIVGTGANNDCAALISAFPPSVSSVVTSADCGSGATVSTPAAIDLQPLTDNGGLTLTRNLGSTSTAIDAGAMTCQAEDQRGLGRPYGAYCDVGAVEYRPGQAGPNFVVNSTADDGVGFCADIVGQCTLRDALNAADGDVSLSVVTFDATVFANPTTISLTQGEIPVISNVTLVGTGQDQLTVDAGGASRHLTIDDGNYASMNLVQISGMTLRNGAGDFGGAVRARENLSLDSVSLLNNSASNQGGGLYFFVAEPATLTITNSAIDDNVGAPAEGGGAYVYAVAGSEVSISNSTFNRNIATGNEFNGRSGGGLAVDVEGTQVTISNSVFNDNQLDSGNTCRGGGIFMDVGTDSVVSLTDVTLSDNTAGTIDGRGRGGGLNIYGEANSLINISNATITGNTAGGTGLAGGGAYLSVYSLDLRDSYFADNVSHRKGGGADIDIYDASQGVIENVTFARNTAMGEGGGFSIEAYDGATVMIRNVTITGNTADGNAGGVYFQFGTDSTITLEDSTVTGNVAMDEGAVFGGAGIRARPNDTGNSFNLSRTIVADNSHMSPGEAPDLAFDGSQTPALTITYNLIGDNTGSGLAEAQTPDVDGNLIGSASGDGIVDPVLGALQDNGGFAPTRLPQPGSPVVDFAAGCSGTDQRGENRDADVDGIASPNECDIGAVEVQNVAVLAMDDDLTSDQNTAAGGNVLTNDLDAVDEDSGALTVTAIDGDAGLVGMGLLLEGFLSIDASGNITFDPDDSYDALDDGESASFSFDYTVTDGFAVDTGNFSLTVTGLNDAPVGDSGMESTNEDTAITRNFDAFDADDEPLTFAFTMLPSQGAITNNGDGSYTFDPAGAFDALDDMDSDVVNVAFSISDSDASDTGTVAITVTGINDAPTAVNDAQTSVDGQILSVGAANGLLANDFDPDDSITLLTTGTFTPTGGGSLTVNADGSFTYDPTGRSADTITFEYTITDGDESAMAILTIGVVTGNETDLSISKDDGVSSVVAGANLTYLITVRNEGSTDVTGAQVTDILPSSLINATWTCTADTGAFCANSGIGDIGELVDLDAGTSVTFALTAQVDPGQGSGVIANTATVTAPQAIADTNLSNNTATDLTAGDGVFSDGFETPVIMKWYSDGKAVVTLDQILARIQPDGSETLILHAQDPGDSQLRIAAIDARLENGQVQARVNRLHNGVLERGYWTIVGPSGVVLSWERPN